MIESWHQSLGSQPQAANVVPSSGDVIGANSTGHGAEIDNNEQSMSFSLHSKISFKVILLGDKCPHLNTVVQEESDMGEEEEVKPQDDKTKDINYFFLVSKQFGDTRKRQCNTCQSVLDHSSQI